jgi:hypothetical protein
MDKKRIGIDINEVLRGLWNQFDKYYIDEFGEDNAPEEADAYTMDFWNDYHWEDIEETTNFLNEDLPDNISPLEYQVDPKTGEAPVDHMAFRPETEKIPARDVYKRFLYQDFCLEIFGMATTMYGNCGKDIEKFYMKYKDQFEISYVSVENFFTISPTLFFLSKTGSRIMNYNFVEEEKDVWDKVDILITANPELIKTVPEGKKVVKIIRPFNEELKGADFEEYNVVNLIEVYERNDDGEIIETKNNDEFDEFIGYVKPEPKEEENKENN